MDPDEAGWVPLGIPLSRAECRFDRVLVPSSAFCPLPDFEPRVLDHEGTIALLRSEIKKLKSDHQTETQRLRGALEDHGREIQHLNGRVRRLDAELDQPVTLRDAGDLMRYLQYNAQVRGQYSRLREMLERYSRFDRTSFD